MKILVVSNNYPSIQNPSRGIFVYKLVQQFANLGHEVTIVSPRIFSIKAVFKKKQNYGEELGIVYRPYYFFTASTKQIGNYNTYRICEKGQIQAVKRTVRKNEIDFDVVYSHFLMNGIVAVQALSGYNKDFFVACGESNIDNTKALFNNKYFQNNLSQINGFIAVSKKLKDKLVSYGVNEKKIVVKPNGVDFTLFYRRDKLEMRRKFGFSENKRLIIFVGRFMHHKGPLRLLNAVEKMDNVGLIFVGHGPQELIGDNIVFNDKVPSELIPELMSAADIFVLPTLREGSSNAIVEAMACGLPIISSDIEEVQDQCDPSFSILVDPLDEEALKGAIKSIIFNDEKLNVMSKNALEYSRRFNIQNRAISILEFIGNG